MKDDYSQFNRLTGRTIRNIMQKFEESVSIRDMLSHVHHRDVSSAETIAAVNDGVTENLKLSICRHSHSSGPLCSNLH